MTRIILIIFSLLSVITFHASSQDVISAERKRAIDSLAMEKVRDLSKYITIIGNKSTPFSEASRVITRAEELFTTDSKMGVSTLAEKGVKYYTIKKYFDRLMALNYTEVKIEWYDINYVSDLERQPDGRYVGVITIYQRFEGKTEENLIYSDVTKKDVTIYVERKHTQIDGESIDFWDVILGDMKVTETKNKS